MSYRGEGQAARAGAALYHVSRACNRAAVQASGLRPQIKEHIDIPREPAIYLLLTLRQARDYAFWFASAEKAAMDIWKVELPGTCEIHHDLHPEMMRDYNSFAVYHPIAPRFIALAAVQGIPVPGADAPPWAERLVDDAVTECLQSAETA